MLMLCYDYIWRSQCLNGWISPSIKLKTLDIEIACRNGLAESIRMTIHELWNDQLPTLFSATQYCIFLNRTLFSYRDLQPEIIDFVLLILSNIVTVFMEGIKRSWFMLLNLRNFHKWCYLEVSCQLVDYSYHQFDCMKWFSMITCILRVYLV